MPLSPAVGSYDAFILDLDGCLWIGETAVPGSPEAVAALRDAGKAIAFVTNETRYAPEDVVRKLWRLGYRAGVHEVVTVGSAVQHLLAERGGGSAFVIGWQAMVDHVALAGMRVVNNTTFASRADVVVVSGHAGFDYAELRTAAQAVLRGAHLVGTSRDATYPQPDGPWPGSGAILAAVEYAAGRPADVVAGKPEQPMYAAARERLGGAARVLAVGDRPEIDVVGARRAGFEAALVTTSGAGADGVDATVAESLAALVLS